MYELILAFIAAFIGAYMNALPGGGTFITYPVLLFLGSSSISANATSTVILWPGLLASLFGYRNEFVKNKQWKKLLIPALLGGFFGAIFLTHTSNDLFNWLAPVLILFGVLIIQFQDRISLVIKRIQPFGKRRIIFISLLILLISIYGGYFGAGIGILLLGTLSMLGISSMHENIALKNALSATINFIAVAVFVFSNVVNWQFVPIMILGAILGGYTGARFVKRLNQSLVRKLVLVIGYIIAIALVIARLK